MARADNRDELDELETLAGGLLAKLDAAARTRLLKTLAHDLRRSQVRRIAAQEGPDGQAWAPRKKRREPVNRRIRFLYRKAGGATRVADLASWQRQGDRLTGFDREAGAIRTFLKSRIQRHLPPEGGADPGALAGGIRGKKGRIKRKAQAMFRKMRQARWLKAGADDQELWVGFTARASRIARVSQYGLRDRPHPDAPEVRYPQRELLGLSREDREAMLSQLLDQIAP